MASQSTAGGDVSLKFLQRIFARQLTWKCASSSRTDRPLSTILCRSCRSQRRSALLKVFRCGPGCNISFWRSVRPALTNLGRRKPWGLVVTYGERALAVEAVIAAGAVLVGLGAPIAVVFRQLVCGWFVDRPLRTQRRPSL